MFPRLATPRLVLDAFTPADVPALAELGSHPEIFATTLRVPHPYTLADAERFIATHLPSFLDGTSAVFAVRHEGRLVGVVGLEVARAHDRAELGYWVGRPYWGRGFATEAARAAVAFAFIQFQLEKVTANHFVGNDASGRVLAKLGFVREGLHARHLKKRDAYLDIVTFGLTRAAAQAAGLLGEDSGATPVPAAPEPAWDPASGAPPPAAFLVPPGAGGIERSIIERHFLGRTPDEIARELRVYGKSLARDFAALSPVALTYYLPAARDYLHSSDADGDWDFVCNLVSSLARHLRGDSLPPATADAARALVRHARDHAPRYFLEIEKAPLSGWIKEALGE
jgi:RimJ/RimL family protein N-acetyltransferase